MPEGDTVKRAAARLHSALAGQPLTEAELRWGRKDGTPLIGRRSLEVVSRGKHLLHRIEGGATVHSHLRMEGGWRTYRSDAGVSTRNPQIRALFATEHSLALGLRLGMLDLIATSAEDRLLGHLGPDVLGPDWDLEAALERIGREPDVPIASAMLDQRNLAGLGTLYTSEALFVQRLHPWTPVCEVAPDAVTAVIERATALMRANVDHAMQSTTGSRRRGEEHFVHARSGRPCRRCGDTIRVAPIGTPPQDRVFFSCPTCQGGRAPTDDGRPQGPLGAGRTPGRGRQRYR